MVPGSDGVTGIRVTRTLRVIGQGSSYPLRVV